MTEPKFKLKERVIYDGDEGVIVSMNPIPSPSPYSYWYTVNIGYTNVGVFEFQLKAKE